ncbi:MAG: DUF4330 domain-containing protein [Bacillota bacterium]|jgi:hypothetical protein|nr:DUF4330 domain-containing protein [Bacillota bacterium]NLL60701.1 DUF4330 domain-containing protein [Tissierellia bacterium]
MSNKKRIGIIDILIVLIIVGAVFYLVKPFKENTKFANNTSKIVYTFETIEVGEEFIDQLQIGKDVFNSSKNYYIGKIKDFKVNPYREEFEDTVNGIIRLEEVPGLYSVLIDIEADALIENDVITVDREEIRVGSYLPIKGKSFASFGYIVAIER